MRGDHDASSFRDALAAVYACGVIGIDIQRPRHCHLCVEIESPDSKAFRRFMAASAEAWNGHGGDSCIGLQLSSLLSKHGLDPIDVRPLQRIARSRSQLWNWPTIYINAYAPKLVEEGRLTQQEHEELLHDWEERTNDPNAFFFAPAMVEILAVKK